jgi:hypothetical protein
METFSTGSSARSILLALTTLSLGTFGCSDDNADPPAGEPPLTLEMRVRDVPPNVEATQCIKARLSNTEPVAIERIVNEISSSSHHFVVSMIDEEKAGEEQLEPFDCEPFRAPLQGAPLAITQKRLDSYQTPPGVGYVFGPNQMIHLELHYINRTDQPVDIVANTKLFALAEGELEHEASVLVVGNLGVKIPPKAEHHVLPTYQEVPEPFHDVNIFAMTGHTHRFGTNVQVGVSPSEDGEVTPKYEPENFVWDNPEVVTFAPTFQVPTGGGFKYSCSWSNPTDQTITFGESANQEMCFFWAYYYPSKKPARGVLLKMR